MQLRGRLGARQQGLVRDGRALHRAERNRVAVIEILERRGAVVC